MLGESIAPGYSMHENAISDLGIISETAALFTASLILVGVLNMIGAYFLFRASGKKSLLLVFVLAGIGAIGAGAISLDNPIGLHSLFALIAFLFFNAQAIACYTVTKGALRMISVGSGVIGLVFLMLMILGDIGLTGAFGVIGHGATERMIVYPAMIWMLSFSGYLMTVHDRLESEIGSSRT